MIDVKIDRWMDNEILISHPLGGITSDDDLKAAYKAMNKKKLASIKI